MSVEPGTDDERAFAAALDALLRQLALEMVADGEGAERVARLVVRGAVEAVDPIARAVANSPAREVRAARPRPELGADPAGGRAGRARCGPVAAQPATSRASTSQTRAARMPLADEALAGSAGDGRAGGGHAPRPHEAEEEAEIFFCDLGHGYVSFNSEYTT